MNRTWTVFCFLLQVLTQSTTTALVNQDQKKIGSPSVTSSFAQKDFETRRISTPRREILQSIVTTAPFLLASSSARAASEQRCDAEDIRCQQDGKLGEAPKGQPIPKVTNRITHVVQIIIDVGERREEAGFIRFGLYGEDCPKSTKELLLFLTRGISSMDQATLENSIGLEYTPVTLTESGSVPLIYSGKAIEFGVQSQAKAYAKSRGVRTAGPNFVPQNRPPAIENENSARPHSAAGLISIPTKGIGYGGGGNVPIDEAYESAFSITADTTPSLDTGGKRRVIGQVIDAPSMQFLSRLASLPVQKGKAGDGSLPGTVVGPPLLKVRVRDIGVQKVTDQGKQGKK